MKVLKQEVFYILHSNDQKGIEQPPSLSTEGPQTLDV